MSHQFKFRERKRIIYQTLVRFLFFLVAYSICNKKKLKAHFKLNIPENDSHYEGDGRENIDGRCRERRRRILNSDTVQVLVQNWPFLN